MTKLNWLDIFKMSVDEFFTLLYLAIEITKKENNIK